MRTVASHSNDPTQVPAPPPTSAHDDALVLVQRGALHVATSWKCRLGLHKFVRRHNSSDPNHQICVRCRKERIATLMGGLFGRFGPGG